MILAMCIGNMQKIEDGKESGQFIYCQTWENLNMELMEFITSKELLTISNSEKNWMVKCLIFAWTLGFIYE